jgi:hypothetical protein
VHNRSSHSVQIRFRTEFEIIGLADSYSLQFELSASYKSRLSPVVITMNGKYSRTSPTGRVSCSTLGDKVGWRLLGISASNYVRVTGLGAYSSKKQSQRSVSIQDCEGVGSIECRSTRQDKHIVYCVVVAGFVTVICPTTTWLVLILLLHKCFGLGFLAWLDESMSEVIFKIGLIILFHYTSELLYSSIPGYMTIWNGCCPVRPNYPLYASSISPREEILRGHECDAVLLWS